MNRLKSLLCVLQIELNYVFRPNCSTYVTIPIYVEYTVPSMNCKTSLKKSGN